MSPEMDKSVDATSKKVRNHVPEDLAFSILSKLPLKSLKRFGCLCKSWTVLFENPVFMSIYRNSFISRNHSYYDDISLVLNQTVNFPSTLYLLSGEMFKKRVKLNLSPSIEELDRDIIILGTRSINGTLCLSSLTNETKVVLWNPATEEFKVIPPSPDESIPYRNTAAVLHGFGYDYVRDDYKVIRRVYFSGLTFFDLENLYLTWQDVPWGDISYDPLWEIYSLRSNSWRKLDVDMPTIPNGVGRRVRVYMDGMCHWGGQSETRSDETYLVSFDLSNEVFFTTLMPSDMDDNFDFKLVHRHLMVLNGSIGLISYYDKTTTFHISILGEIGVKESWTKLFIVGSLPCVKHPIGAGKNGDIFFIKKDGELAWFDLSTQMIEELGIKGKIICDQIVVYKKSLLPIGG